VTPRTAMRTRILVVEDEPAIAVKGWEPDWTKVATRLVRQANSC